MQATVARADVCPACGGSDMRALPAIGDRSMLSDGRIVPYPLRRHACAACGLAAHVDPPSTDTTRDTFASGYDLYAHPPGDRFERERQQRYAGWIGGLTGSISPASVFEIGCGNGSLLLELQSIWPAASFSGIEPAAAAANHARNAGFTVADGFLESGGENTAADIVIAVNVVEHSSEPIRFLRAFRDRMAVSGRGIVICPDGDIPSVELLIFDHLHSFSGVALARICAAAGLRVAHQSKAPTGLAGFQAAVVGRGGDTAPATDPEFGSRLLDARRRFLLAWQQLDGRLLERVEGRAELICFGTGECAQLLRVYAPRLWERVAAFAIDGGAGFFDGRPVLDYAGLRPAPGRAILPAVRHELHPTMYRRLRDDGHEFVAWDDLLPA